MITTNKTNFIKICDERGYILEDVMGCVARQDGDIWTIDEHHPNYPKIKINNNPTIKKLLDNGEGVGTELKKILSWFNINSSPTCSCNARAKQMNENGIHWCENNKDLIISWLKEEAIKRNMLFSVYIAKKILNLAIQRAKKSSIMCKI